MLGAQQLGALGNKSIPEVLVGAITPQLIWEVWGLETHAWDTAVDPAPWLQQSWPQGDDTLLEVWDCPLQIAPKH